MLVVLLFPGLVKAQQQGCRSRQSSKPWPNLHRGFLLHLHGEPNPPACYHQVQSLVLQVSSSVMQCAIHTFVHCAEAHCLNVVYQQRGPQHASEELLCPKCT